MASDVEKQEMPDELIEVFTTKNRGRGVRVTREVKAGCLLLTEEPFEFVVKNGERGYYCDQCLAKRDDILHKCSACRFAYYCNRDCQRAAWSSHKLECEGISRVTPNVPSDHVRLMSRLSRKRKKQPAATVNGSVTFPTHIDHLQSVPTDLRGDTQLEFSSWLYTLRRFMGEESNVMLPAEVLELFGRMRCNTCDISDGELQSLGIGLYLKFSMFNHSCDYNCVAIHNGTSMSVRATRDILANKECFVCYVDVLKPTASRNAILRNVFQFMCKCHTCRDTKREQLRHSVRCGNPECREAVLLNPDGSVKRCSQCTFDGFPPDFSEQLKLVEQQCMAKLSAAEEIMSFGNWLKILQLSEQCLTLQKGILHPYHHLVLETLHYAMDACIHLEKWELALEYGLRSIEHIDFHCPGNNPNAAIQLMRVGKLQQYLKMIPEATKNLQKAENIMLITHGSDHPLFASLKEMLAACAIEKRQTCRLESIEEAEPDLEVEHLKKSMEIVEITDKTEDASQDTESGLKDSSGGALKMDDANASQQLKESAAKSTDNDAAKVSNDHT
ncbi:histone-lysine N-methyltransferase SMYD3-like [Asterias amurensis]|uniref:histone-lysine N-methyltransferase SMYD3-like n=1 Tax=Asterias amurensis TaxID=7602 RepID=UPI003AB193B8